MPLYNHVNTLQRGGNPNYRRSERPSRSHGILSPFTIAVVRQRHTLGICRHASNLVLEPFEIGGFVLFGQHKLLCQLNVVVIDCINEWHVLARASTSFFRPADCRWKSYGPLEAATGGNVLVASRISYNCSYPITEPIRG